LFTLRTKRAIRNHRSGALAPPDPDGFADVLKADNPALKQAQEIHDALRARIPFIKKKQKRANCSGGRRPNGTHFAIAPASGRTS